MKVTTGQEVQPLLLSVLQGHILHSSSFTCQRDHDFESVTFLGAIEGTLRGIPGQTFWVYSSENVESEEMGDGSGFPSPRS